MWVVDAGWDDSASIAVVSPGLVFECTSYAVPDFALVLV